MNEVLRALVTFVVRRYGTAAGWKDKHPDSDIAHLGRAVLDLGDRVEYLEHVAGLDLPTEQRNEPKGD